MTDHRIQADDAWTNDEPDWTSAHALLAIHNLLDERLPSNPGGRAGDLRASERDSVSVGVHDAESVTGRERDECADCGRSDGKCDRWVATDGPELVEFTGGDRKWSRENKPVKRPESIDPDSITEWTWCLVRDGGDGGEQVVQVKGGRFRAYTTGIEGDLPNDWTIVTDDVRFGGEQA